MYKCVDITKLNDYFKEYSTRNPKGVYFYRINGFNENIKSFIIEYFKKAEKYGAVIEFKIQNPTEKNLEYYEEIMGNDFSMSLDFITKSLKKWLPEIDDFKIQNLANSIYDIFTKMSEEGKNTNMIKNAYIKFMCWFYYKFKRVLNLSGENNIPKIIYQGNISMYELKFLSVLSGLGCDIILLQYEGDLQYIKIDNKSSYSKEYKEPSMTDFPKDFSIEKIRNLVHTEQIKLRTSNISKNVQNNSQNTYNNSDIKRGTNIWLTGDVYSDVLKNPLQRGDDKNIYYNAFIRILGTDDKSNYVSELYNFYNSLKESKRNISICDNGLEIPSVDEISKIKRGMYSTVENMAFDISKNINYNLDKDLCSIIRKNFIDIVIEESKNINGPLNRVTNKAVYILCWLNRFVYELYKNTDYKNLPVFIFFGDCENENQALFLRFLSMLPVDVVIISPNIENKFIINDKFIFEKEFQYSSDLKSFPKDNVNLRAGTVAYHAERDLENIMYNNSGIYKNRQYDKADAISLNTMYE